MDLIVAAVVAMLSVIVIINGEQEINTKPFDLIKSCGQGIGILLGQTSDVPSTIHCSVLCGEEEECCSFVYDPVSKACALHNDSVADTSSLPEDCGIFIGQKDIASCRKGPCANIGACTSSWRVCAPGCSFDPRTWKCVEYCTEYGTTFQKHPWYLITGFNTVQDLSGRSEEECKIYCASISTFVCRSIDFGHRGGIDYCNLSNEAALSKHDAYIEVNDFEHFARDCAP